MALRSMLFHDSHLPFIFTCTSGADLGSNEVKCNACNNILRFLRKPRSVHWLILTRDMYQDFQSAKPKAEARSYSYKAVEFNACLYDKIKFGTSPSFTRLDKNESFYFKPDSCHNSSVLIVPRIIKRILLNMKWMIGQRDLKCYSVMLHRSRSVTHSLWSQSQKQSQDLTKLTFAWWSQDAFQGQYSSRTSNDTPQVRTIPMGNKRRELYSFSSAHLPTSHIICIMHVKVYRRPLFHSDKWDCWFDMLTQHYNI